MQREARTLRRRRALDVWLMLAPLFAWAVHFLMSYLAGSIACAPGSSGTHDGTVILWGTILPAIVALAVIGGAALLAVRRIGASGALPRAAVVIAVLSAMGVVWQVLPAILSPGC